MNTGEAMIARRTDNMIEDLLSREYTKGIQDERNRIIEILENHWLSGSVARRIIDEIIEDIKKE